jgi:NAD(P)-dependent dehydrogenase (short-subunit alcohol dehydrogenase family)
MPRVAIVTGASRGIGAAIAERLAAHGMHVALAARTLESEAGVEGSLHDVAERIRSAGGTAVSIGADLSVPDDRRRIVDEATRQLGPVDVLVNNAAVTFMYPFTEFPEKRWRLMFEVQVRAPYELAQLVVPGMLERGEGWILNISSRVALHPEGPPFPAVHIAPWSTYAMAKAALDRFSTALAAELSPFGVAVNALAPFDNVATPGATAHDLVEGFPLESPDLMAEAALLLCTGDPAVLTGRVANSQELLAELAPAALEHR